MSGTAKNDNFTCIYYSINIQLNDIKNIPLKSILVCYFGETICVCFENTWEEVLKTITEDIQLIEQWFIVNNLFYYYDKTVILLHSEKTNTLPNKKDFILHYDTCNTYDINCQYKKINIMIYFKYFGTEMCSNLK